MAQIKTLLVIKLYVISKNIFIYKNISRYIFQNDFVNQMMKKLEVKIKIYTIISNIEKNAWLNVKKMCIVVEFLCIQNYIHHFLSPFYGDLLRKEIIWIMLGDETLSHFLHLIFLHSYFSHTFAKIKILSYTIYVLSA